MLGRLPVRRVPRGPHRAARGGGQLGEPDVVFGDERQQVPRKVREPQIRGLRHQCSYTPGTDGAAAAAPSPTPPSAISIALSSCGSSSATKSCGRKSTLTVGSQPWFSKPYRPDGVEGQRVARLRDERAVHQVEAVVHTDDATPGARADHGHPVVLERLVDDVTVAAGLLVAHRDHRSGRRVRRVGVGQLAARELPPERLAQQPLHDERGGDAAAVAARVDHQSVLHDLSAQIAVELGPPRLGLVRQVYVAQPSAGLLQHVRATVGDPSPVAQLHLVGDRDHDHRPPVPDGFSRTSSVGWSALPASSAAGPTRGGTGDPSTAVIASPTRAAMPGASSGDRAAGTELSPGRILTIAPHAVLVRSQVGTEQTLLPRSSRERLRRVDVGVRGPQLALQFPQQVHEVVVGRGGRDQRRVAVADRLPVHAVHGRLDVVLDLKPPRVHEGLLRSASGTTDSRIRDRSTDSGFASSSALSAGRADSASWSVTTRRAPSPETA